LSLPPVAYARRQRKIVAACRQQCGLERRRGMAIAQAQKRRHRQMRTGRFASDRQERPVELDSAFADQPQSGALAIVGPHGKGGFRSQPVVHGNGGQSCRFGETAQAGVVLPGRAHDPAAAVKVQIDPARQARFRVEDAQADRPMAAFDVCRDRVGIGRQQRKRTSSRSPRRADFRQGIGPDVGRFRQAIQNGAVQRTRLLRNGVRRENGRIDGERRSERHRAGLCRNAKRAPYARRRR
jgi:hypothetical protein